VATTAPSSQRAIVSEGKTSVRRESEFRRRLAKKTGQKEKSDCVRPSKKRDSKHTSFFRLGMRAKRRGGAKKIEPTTTKTKDYIRT